MWTDGGGKFKSHSCRDLLYNYDIKLYSTHSELKAIMAERFNQTLLNKTSKIVIACNSYRYIDDIYNIVNKYNNTNH